MIKILIAILLIQLAFSQMPDFYDPVTSKSLLYYAKASYCDASQIKNWSGQACKYHPGVTSITVITNLVHGTQMYLAYDPNQNNIVLAFRGSTNIQNWIDNLDYVKTEYPYCTNCQVHQGFYTAWNGVKDQVISTYTSLLKTYPNAKTVVTGHSLGGALSQLCALELRHSGYNVDSYYNFGCPRVGNQEFAAYGSKQLPYEVEVIHYHDPVPHLPLEIQGFVRIPTETYYYSKTDVNAYKWCPSAGGTESNQCSDKLLLATDIEDHLHYLGVYTGCTDQESLTGKLSRLAYSINPNSGLHKYARLEQQALQTTQEDIKQIKA